MSTHSTWNRIQGAWKQLAGSVHEEWGKLTHDDIAQIDGKRERLVGKIQERYGIVEEEANKQVSTWETKVKD
jgi:uncharacterized protein YjbJ (UPF0337 family)